jgi:hypothetical protein
MKLMSARDFFARGILIALQVLDRRNEPPPFRFESGKLGQILGGIEAALPQARLDLGEMVADVHRIEHGSCYKAL